MNILLQKTAWPMTPPAPYSLFHIIICTAGILTAAVWARRINCTPVKRNGTADSPARRPSVSRIFWLCGLILALGEVYKQLFLYEIVNDFHYDWWYFPFQLCSTPMYVCLMFPFLPSGPWQKSALIYLQDFSLLGGIMALAFPFDLMHPYWTLTLHGLLWHLILIFISFFAAGTDLYSHDAKSFFCSLPLFFLFCLIATAINCFHRESANMFYISPFQLTTQPVFRQIAARYGIPAGNMVYLISICTGAFLCHIALNTLFKGAKHHE